MLDLTPFKEIFNNHIDILLSSTGLTVPCLLVFDRAKSTQCPNCIFDNIGRKSANRYKLGGPVSFGQGQICPVCLGKGLVENEASETINLAVVTDYNKFVSINKVNIPNGYIQSYCSIEHYVKITTCNYIVVDSALKDILSNKFIRASSPQPIGLGDSSYLLTTWRKPGNEA